MKLVGIDANPIPADPVLGKILADDGVSLRYAYWRGGAQRRGTVCILQGRAECIEKYFEVIAELRARGFAVAALDWRGQGGSERLLPNARSGHVEDFRQYDRDLDAFMRQIVLPDCPPPYFALGHSMGSLIGLRAARLHGARFSRMVLVAPMLRLKDRLGQSGAALGGAAALRLLGFGDLPLPGREMWAPDIHPFLGNRNTSDPARYERFADVLRSAPQLAIGGATFGWLHAAGRAMREAVRPGFAAPVQVPILLLTAGQDEVVDNTAAARLARDLRAGAELEIAGARHEILCERDSLRTLLWAAFDAFVPGSSLQ